MPGTPRVFVSFGQDVRFALRQIAGTPLFSGIVIAVIALGIGINAGMLTLLNTYAWRPAPGIASQPDLVRLTPMAARGRSNGVFDVTLSYPELELIRAERSVFADVAGWEPSNQGVDLGGGTETMRVNYVTGNFFRLLRVTLAAGAGLPEDVDRSAAPVVVIGHSLWTSHFNSSPDAIGKTIRVMNIPFTIVGVAPPRFVGVDVNDIGQSPIWVANVMRRVLEPTTDPTRRTVEHLQSFARLAPGVDVDDVSRKTATLGARMAQLDQQRNARFLIRAERLRGLERGDSGTKELFAVFFVVMTLIVVITCTNVSALLLGRAVARRREIGIRLSLGATRLRLMRQMMTESLVYAMAGGLLSFVLYAATMKIAYATLPEVIPGMEAQPATFGFTAIFVLATTIVFGLAPALHATSADIGEVIKNSGTQSIRRSRLQAAFVVAQLACSQPVLVVTSLVLADLRRGVNENADKAPASVVMMSTEFIRPIPVRPDSDAIRDSIAVTNRATLALIRQRLARVPGLQSAAIRHAVGSSTYESTSGGPTSLQVSQVFVTPEFWATMGIPIARGRGFGVDDDRVGSAVALVNEEAAKRLWPGEDPVGKRLVRRVRDASTKSASLEVIGVAGRAAYEEQQQTPELYLPLSNAPSVLEPTMIVRTSGDARASMPQIRVAIREIDPYIAVGDVVTLAERYAARKREAFLSNAAAFAVGAVALLLASLGLYAIIAFSVAQRTREIGIRLAMGATPHGVVSHFLRHGVRVSAIALAIGVPTTVAGIRIVQANVIGFTIESFVTVMLVVPALIGVAVVASWLPARRAGRVDPLVALRSE